MRLVRGWLKAGVVDRGDWFISGISTSYEI